MKLGRTLIVFALLSFGTTGWTQGWSPRKNVEIVVTTAPSGSNDKTARTVERIFVAHKLVPSSLTVVNKPGGAGGIAYNYIDQHAGDAHYLLIGTPGLLTNHILGRIKMSHADFVTSAQFRKDLEKDYADMKSVLLELGLAKQ